MIMALCLTRSSQEKSLYCLSGSGDINGVKDSV
jgi:hypothetical protein